MNINLSKLLFAISCGFVFYMSVKLYMDVIRPYQIKKSIKVVKKNPEWLIPALRSHYYGLDDVDILLVESKHKIAPQFQLNVIKKDEKAGLLEMRLELLLPSTVTIAEIDEIAKIALIGKICTKVNPQVGMTYANKPTYWLSILCYMLDGGSINQSAVSWNDKN